MWFDIDTLGESFGYWETADNWRDVVAVSAVLSGWQPHGIYRSENGVSLVEFRSGTESATWFLDDKLRRIGGSIHELSPEAQKLVSAAFIPIIETLYQDVLVESKVASDQTGFLKINLLTRIEVARLCFPSMGESLVENVRQSTDDLSPMLSCLYRDFQESIIKGANNDGLEFLDPDDGGTLLVKHGIALDDFRAIYLVQTRAGRRYWACVTGHYATIVGLYEPLTDRYFVTSDYNASNIKGSFPSLRMELRRIAAEMADILPAYLNASGTRVGSFLRPPPANHLGHQLWNELSGIQAALNFIKRDKIPRIIIPLAERGTEAFGPTEEIFPELRRAIIRLGADVDFRRYAIIAGLTLVRLSQRKISAELRARINVRVNCRAEAQVDQALLSGYLLGGKKIVLLGLRVENRTLCDLDGFLRTFLRLCAKTLPSCVVVIDGHNSKVGEHGVRQVFASHGQWAAKRQPIDVEYELAASAAQLAEELNVEVLNLIGEAVDRSLFWSLHADRFVTIWGAGLAKYRWVANRPGFVLTSAWNRLHRPDLHIYSSSEFMDDPEDIDFVPADEVDDLPEAEQLVKFNSDQQPESYQNFALKDADNIWFIEEYLKKIH